MCTQGRARKQNFLNMLIEKYVEHSIFLSACPLGGDGGGMFFLIMPETYFYNFFFFFPIFGLKQPNFRKKVFFCLVVRGVYPPNILIGPTTKKKHFYMCVFPKKVDPKM